jgi:predicted Zn-dependent protease
MKGWKTMRSYLILFAALVGMMLLAGGCAVNPVTGQRELALFAVSTSQEVELGRQAFAPAVQQMGGEYPDAALAAYINQVGSRLGAVSQRPELSYQFKVVNDSTPNAFALPGGFIAITRGLLVSIENEAQLAAVLGHELGHVTARHSVQAMQRGKLMNVGLAALGAATESSTYGGLAQQAGQLAAGLLENSYSRDQERQADRLGVDYMVLAGYDPRGAVQLQEFFYRKIEQGAEPVWLAGLFRTHPFSKERMLNVQGYIAERYPQVAGRTRYGLRPEPFQQAMASLEMTRRGYELYDQAVQLENEDRLPEAIATYLQAATAAPDQALILTGLGMAYLRSRDVRAARPHLARAVQLDDNYFLSRLGLGLVYLELDDAAAAVRELEASMEHYPTTRGGYLLAMGYEQQGDRAKALTLYRQVAETDADSQIGQAAVAKVKELEGP